MIGRREIVHRLSMDWRANSETSRLASLLTARWNSVLLFRIAQLVGTLSGPLAGIVKQFNQALSGADLAWQADVGGGLVLFHPNGVVLGQDAQIGQGAQIQQGVTIGSKRGGFEESSAGRVCPRIGDNCRLGAGSRLLGDIVIGDRVTVGANAVVTNSFPDDAVLVGMPARRIGN